MRGKFVSALIEEMRVDESIFVITADMGFGVFEDLKLEFPERFLNTGVAEANSVAIAAGLAMSGFKVVFYAQAPFATMRCFEQIRLDVASNNLNVKVVGTSSGFTLSQYGTSHYAVEDVGIMRILPNFTIICPGDLQEAEQATKFILNHSGPAYLRIGRSNSGPDIKIHKKKKILKRGRPIFIEGNGDVAIFATGSMLFSAYQVYKLLFKVGIKTSLFSVPFIKPIDGIYMKKAMAGKKIIFTIEEHSEIGGLGTAISEFIIKENIKIQMIKIGTKDKFVHLTGSRDFLLSQHGLSVSQIKNFIKQQIRKTGLS